MFAGGMIEGSKERWHGLKKRSISQALEPDTKKQRKEYERIITELKKAEGTDIQDILGDETYLALGFLGKMIKRGMPGALALPTTVYESRPIHTRKKLFRAVEVLQEEIEMQDFVRGYIIGATEVSREPDGADEEGYYHYNPGAAVYICNDGAARQSAKAAYVGMAFGEGRGFPFDGDIYDGVMHPSDFRTGRLSVDEALRLPRFYPMPLEHRLGQLAAEKLPI